MKFIRGKELKESIRRMHENAGEGKIDFNGVEFRQLLKRFQDICNTIEYAHSRGILHRDLKPANVMLGSHGETLVVDWGLAKILSQDAIPEEASGSRSSDLLTPIRVRSSGENSATQYGSFSGTVAYAPPEQLLGQLDRMGPQSDVYSLGAILFETITNEAPIRSDMKSLKDVVEAIRQGDMLDPRTRIARVPRPLAMICRKAMAYEPMARYPSAQDLSEDIDRWLADERVLAIGHDEPISERLGRWLRKYRSWTLPVAAALLFSALVFGIGAILINQARIAERSAKESEQDAKQKELLSKREAIDRNAIARDAIDTLLMESSKALADFPATRDLQKRLLAAAAADYQRLSQGTSNDESLQLERLRALVRVADIEALQGNVDASNAKYAEALDALAAFLPRLKNEREALLRWRIELAKTIARRALAWDVSDRTEDAMQEFERARTQWEGILREEPDSTQARFLAARTQAQHADLIGRAQSAEPSIEMLESAIARFEGLEPTNEPRLLLESRKARESLARNLGRLGRIAEAIPVLESIVQDVAASSDAEPEREALETIARVRVSLANLHRQQGDYVTATTRLEEAAEGYAQLRQEWPDSLEYVENEASTYADIGLLWLDRQQPQSAQPFLARAVELFESLHNSYRTVPRFAFGLGAAWSGLGQVALKIDPEPSVALDLLVHSRELFQELSLANRDAASIESLAAVTGQWARALERAGQLEEADSAFQRAHEYYTQLIENRPGEPRYVFGLAEVQWHWGSAAHRNNLTEQAHERWVTWLASMRGLTDRFPENGVYQHRLAQGLLRHPEAFAEAAQQAEAFARRAYELQPANRLFVLTLAEACIALDRTPDARRLLDSISGQTESELPEFQGLTALLQHQSGDSASAKEWLNRCRRSLEETAPFDQELQDWAARIEKVIRE
jgi:eukaryotic-like serine/threonine-protein kinase